MRLHRSNSGKVDEPVSHFVKVGLPRQPLGDIYHYLLTASWPLLVVLIAGTFASVNALFALGYLLDGGIRNARPGSFVDLFFFSIQTMATIGYGHMAPATLFANLMVTVEALTGLIGLALVTGLTFAKFSRPTSRVRFSQRAVISNVDGRPHLMFRMANVRGNQIVEAQLHVALIRVEMTLEGERVRRVHDLELVRDRHPYFKLSWTAMHPVGEGSPLCAATSDSLRAAQAVIIVSLTGLDESFSQTVHARHSYAVADIVWGARLADIFVLSQDGSWLIDYSRFDDVVEVQSDPLESSALAG